MFIFFLKKILHKIKESMLLFYSILLLLILLVVIFEIEHRLGNQMFSSGWDGIRWGIITAGTIGYGDKFPQSFWGQFLAVFYIFVSLGIFTQIITKIIDYLNSKTSRKMNGTLKTRLKNHIIIYGENDLSFSNVIEEILNSQNKEQIVVITQDTQIPKEILKLDSKYGSNIDWISGKPDDAKVLELANTKEASSFILFREDTNINSDKFLLSYILNIKDYNPNIKIIADIVNSKNKKLFHSAGCTTIINTEEISEKLLYRSLTDGIHGLINDLLEHEGFEIYKVNMDSRWIGKIMKDLHDEYLQKNKNVIAIGNNENIYYNSDYKINNGDFAFVISENKINII